MTVELNDIGLIGSFTALILSGLDRLKVDLMKLCHERA